MNGPLKDLRVLEFGHVAAGPFAGMLLADLGADVVKVEPPTGDHMRRWPPFADTAGGEFSMSFSALNRNKRSLRADLKDDEQRQQVAQLARRADVVIENYRPGVLDRLGLGYRQLAAESLQGLVYCSITGYGQVGPYRDHGAFDVVIQAQSGLMSVTGPKGGDPVKCGVPVGDFVAGLYAAYSVLAALNVRRDEARSVYIDCPMLSSLVAISALQTAQYWGTGTSPSALGSAHAQNAPYQNFDAADGTLAVAAGTDTLWKALAEAVGRPDLPSDPRFGTQRDRVLHQEALATELSTAFIGDTVAHWLHGLRARGVPCGPVNSFADILCDPHVQEIGLVQPLDLPDGSSTSTVRFPAVMHDVPMPPTRPAPLLGADTDSVLGDWLS